ncbi:MAG: hypothetical protein ACRCU5_11860 [Rhizobiaceae bacterium]
MDSVNIVFYALICGTLAAYAPTAGGRSARFVLGIGVGVIAASLLPFIRSFIGL